MKWITRERPKIDRIACPWLIKRFVDKEAEFIYVPFDKVIKKSKELSAIPFDLPDVEYTHYGDECTFDYIIRKHKLRDPALDVLAVIVRGMKMYDALYSWAKHVHGEKHNWNPAL